MFAVSGTWKMDNSLRERQAAVLPQLVAGVRQNPGFVRGFWANDLEQQDLSVTFVVFETLDQARSFREAVMANAPRPGGGGERACWTADRGDPGRRMSAVLHRS